MNSIALIETNGRIYNYNDLINCLHQIGIGKGDILCVHTELIALGRPLVSKNEFLDSIITSNLSYLIIFKFIIFIFCFINHLT